MARSGSLLRCRRADPRSLNPPKGTSRLRISIEKERPIGKRTRRPLWTLRDPRSIAETGRWDPGPRGTNACCVSLNNADADSSAGRVDRLSCAHANTSNTARQPPRTHAREGGGYGGGAHRDSQHHHPERRGSYSTGAGAQRPPATVCGYRWSALSVPGQASPSAEIL